MRRPVKDLDITIHDKAVQAKVRTLGDGVQVGYEDIRHQPSSSSRHLQTSLLPIAVFQKAAG